MNISPKLHPNSLNWHKNLLWIIPSTIVWLVLWFFPWQGLFRSFYWLPLGIGITLFVIPGVCLYGLLANRPGITISHVTFGFVISHFIFAILGTLGRLTHLSFETIKIIMSLASLILFLNYVYVVYRGIRIPSWQINKKDLLSILFLLLIALAACLVVIQRTPSDDDLTYLAYLTNWQNSHHLDFNETIFGTSELVHSRFWLLSAPFAQALLADISQIPGILLLGGYYEPFLVILATFCWYELARTLGFSPQAASASSIVQLVFLLLLSEYLHPGAPFYRQLSSDKASAAFIIVPVFFQSLFQLLRRSTNNNFIIFFMVGFSLSLMHPIILAYSIFIGSILLLFNWKNIRVKEKVITILIFLIILIPHITMRFSNTYSQGEIPYTSQDIFVQRGIENLIQRWGETQFYGFNPSILDMKIPYGKNLSIPQLIIAKGWLILPILSVIFAIKQIRRKQLAQFILSCFLLSLLVWIPFTGWIFGYFLSAYMLERAIWLFPFGLSAVYPFLILRGNIQNRLRSKTLSSWNRFISPNWQLTIITVISLGLFSLYLHENNLPNIEKFLDKSQRYQGLSNAGMELNQRISDSAYVIGSPNLNDIIPGVSWKSKLITFRISDPLNMSYYTQKERDERISDTQELFLNSPSAEDKMNILEKHNVRFLFITPFDLRLFDELLETYPSRVSADEAGGVIIISINP